MLSLGLQVGVRLICPKVAKGKKLRLLPFLLFMGKFSCEVAFRKEDSHVVANVVTIIGK